MTIQWLESWDEARARNLLDEMSTRDGDQIVIDSGIALSGIAHWNPRKK